MMPDRSYRYIVRKILNNNALISEDENNREIIVTGKGIGFHAHVGMKVDSSKIFKIYDLRGTNAMHKFETLLDEIPFECIQLSQEIIEMAQTALNQILNQNLILALSDHINFTVNQVRSGGGHPTLMSDEIRRFYKDEYGVGLLAVDMINQKYGITLPKEEASSIAFHLINAESDVNISETTRIITGTTDILQIIERSMHIHPKEDSLSYSRLVTHVRYFMKRVLDRENSDEGFLINTVFFNEEDEQYQRIAVCMDQIKAYLKETYSYEMNDAERVYLLIHVTRVVMTSKSDQERENRNGSKN